MRDAVVICTLDRPELLAEVIAAVLAQSERPPCIVLVDGSLTGSAEVVSRAYLPGYYLRVLGGLTAQRNAGIRVLPADVDLVHFLDDDVRLTDGYFAAIRAEFRDPAVVGVGGVITNAPAPRPYFARRLFLIDSRQPGKVLRSGHNVMAFDPQQPIDVQWLSGCSMSYRRSLLESIKFDESMGGYCLGEDLDFALRARPYGRLVVTPAARLEHLRALQNRWHHEQLAEEEIVARYWRVRKHRGRLSPLAFWWATFGTCALAVLRAAVRRHPATVREVVPVIRGVRRIRAETTR